MKEYCLPPTRKMSPVRWRVDHRAEVCAVEYLPELVILELRYARVGTGIENSSQVYVEKN